MAHPVDKRPVIILVIVSLVTFICHVTTVKYYPLAWLDEVEIIEMGRYSTYDQHPVCSVSLSPTLPASMPEPFIYYIGGFVQETLYRVTGSFIAPRCFALAGLLFAVAFFYAWLRMKGFSPWITLCSALLLLSDTNVTVGVHWYRLDMWVMGMTFLNALLVLRCSGKPAGVQRRTLIAVGGIMAFQMFFWLTAVIQWPLVLAEVLALAAAEKWNFRRYLLAGVAGTSGLLLACGVLLIPLYGGMGDTISHLLTHTEIGSTLHRLTPAINDNATASLLQSVLERGVLFLKLISRTPFVWLGAFVGCFFWRRHRSIFIAFILCVSFVIMTHVYHARVNYLTPFVFLFLTEGLAQLSIQRQLVRYGAAVFLTLALTYSFLLSVIGLNYFARPTTQQNTYDALLSRMSATIGNGPRHIYTFTYDIYYVGRKLGWHMFSFLPGRSEALFEVGVSQPPLADLEYIVVGDDYKLSPGQEGFFNEHGFHLWQRVELPADKPGRLTARFRDIIYARGYPSFNIWKKEPAR